MPHWLLVTIILLVVGCIITAYVTALACKRRIESEWQEITYAGGSIEPIEIYICKNCNYQADDIKYHYCSNCGALMRNGISRHYFSEKIKISE